MSNYAWKERGRVLMKAAASVQSRRVGYLPVLQQQRREFVLEDIWRGGQAKGALSRHSGPFLCLEQQGTVCENPRRCPRQGGDAVIWRKSDGLASIRNWWALLVVIMGLLVREAFAGDVIQVGSFDAWCSTGCLLKCFGGMEAHDFTKITCNIFHPTKWFPRSLSRTSSGDHFVHDLVLSAGREGKQNLSNTR